MKKITNTKTKTTKAPKATPAGAEPELGNAQGITINDGTEVIKTEEARQAQMKTDLAKVKAGDKKRKAAVKAAKAPKATPEKAAKVAKPAKAKATKAPKPAKAAKEPKAAGTSKKDQVLALISRKNGASLDEIMTATGWQKHTVRGFIAILGKKGTKIESFKSEAGARTYKAA
jgi:glucan-binding YG repeat protein